MAVRHAMLVLATAGTAVAAAEDALTAAMGRAADSLAATLNKVAKAENPPLEVAVRPARMDLDGIYVHCQALSRDLQDRLREKLDDVRQRMGLDFSVRAVAPGVVAVAEINTEWQHDVRNGADMVQAVVRVKVHDYIFGGSETRLQPMSAEDLTVRQRRCLMTWTHDERYVTVPEGRPVTVFEEPGLGGTPLTVYEHGDRMHIYGDVQPLGTQGSWQLVRLEGQRPYGFAKVPEQPGQTVNRAPLEAGDRFRDCPECPEMVVVPAGSYRMGSPSYEQGRRENEGPVHEVTIAAPFAIGRHEVTVAEFGRFVDETGYSTGGSCYTTEGGIWRRRTGRGWRSPGFEQSGRFPVVCVNWSDARAYAGWLSGRTGEAYRLPSESEWEYAARAGTSTSRYWGEGESSQCRHENGADASAKERYPDWGVASCRDGHVYTAPVGSFLANHWGSHDMLGNVSEWTEDCWNDGYMGAPSDGNAWRDGDCAKRVVRGGSWGFRRPLGPRSAFRHGSPTDFRHHGGGFRVARRLTP